MLPPSPSRRSTTARSPVKMLRSKVVVPFPSAGASNAEPIKTYLRLRPAQASKPTSEPYITVHNETDIVMKPPADLPRASQHYSFAKVFQPAEAEAAQESQSSFFQETCLPMVEGLLNEGQNGLYCTYGTTCSGKSYTVHGGSRAHEAGVLPRTLDTIFNSLDGLLSTRRIRPRGLQGVEELVHEEQDGVEQFDPMCLPPLRQKLLDTKGRPTLGASASMPEYEHDTTTIKVDKNYRYSVWISYLEVYNEKLYDLLDVGPESSTGTAPGSKKNWSLGGRRMGSVVGADVSGMASGAGTGAVITRHALSLQNDADTAGDPEGQCKYAAGLSEHEVRSAAEAQALIRRGEQNRAVFGTMANRVSSRSHGVFTVRIIRHHAGEVGAEAMYTTSRMSIVDLAGSERMANTQLTDQARMKEAGNINKSLMNLGHCIEKIRGNQTRVQASLVSGGAEASKSEVVPYNSSKLTALLKTYFVGEGSTVMIITANPFDGGFYENAQVMKFSATIRDVTRQRQSTAIPRSPTKISLAPQPGPGQGRKMTSSSSLTPRPTGSRVRPASVAPPRPTRTRTPEPSEMDITIIEEGEEEEQDPLVDLLLAKCEELQQRLYLAEHRAATIEAEARAEMADVMERALREMSRMYEQRLEEELRLSEQITNKKLDLLNDLCQESRTHEHEASASASFQSASQGESGALDMSKTQDEPTVSQAGKRTSPTPTPVQHGGSYRTPSVAESDILARALERVRVFSDSAPGPATPGRTVLPAVIPEVHTPGDPFRSIAVKPDALAPRGSFGGSPTRIPRQSSDSVPRSILGSNLFGESDAQAGQPEQSKRPEQAPQDAADATTIEVDVSTVETAEDDEPILNAQTPRRPSAVARPAAQSELSSASLEASGSASSESEESTEKEDNSAQSGSLEEGSSEEEEEEEEEEDDDDESFNPSGNEPSLDDVTPPSPKKRRSTRASTAASTQAASTRARERTLSRTKRCVSPAPRKPTKARPGSLLQSTRPAPAAIEAAARLAPTSASPTRKRSVLNRTRNGAGGGPVKRERKPSAGRLPSGSFAGILSDAGAEVNRRPTAQHVDLDLSADASLLKPPPDSPKKKRRALRTSGVNEAGVTLQLDA